MTEAEGLNANDFPEAILIDHRPMVIVCRAVLTAREGFPPPDLIRWREHHTALSALFTLIALTARPPMTIKPAPAKYGVAGEKSSN